MKKLTGIYLITSPSGRKYVGQSVDINRRFASYKLVLCTNQKMLYRSFKKYGVDNHVFSIIEECNTESLYERESFYISFFDSYNPVTGMNCTKGGGGVRGVKWSDAARSKLSKSIRKMYDNGHVNHFTGKKHSDETKKKIGLKSIDRGNHPNLLDGFREWRKDAGKVAEANEKRKVSLKESWVKRRSGEQFNSDEAVQSRKKPRPYMKLPKSGHRGVHFEPKKKLYKVIICFDKKTIIGGRFKKIEDAITRYNELAKQYHGAA